MTCKGCARAGAAIVDRGGFYAPICPVCLARSDAEIAQLHRERDRLCRRGLGPREASVVMNRRVHRYFADGTFVALGRAGAA